MKAKNNAPAAVKDWEPLTTTLMGHGLLAGGLATLRWWWGAIGSGPDVRVPATARVGMRINR
jgi:hypothetical protein